MQSATYLAKAIRLTRTSLEEISRRADLGVAPELGVRDEPHFVIGNIL
jgi:hypothetical protein